MQINEKQKNMLFDLAIGLFGLIALIMIRPSLMNVINPFIYAAVVAYLLNPLVNYLEKKKVKRTIAILLVFVFILGLFFTVIMTFVPKLARDVSVFIGELPAMLDFVMTFIEDFRSGQVTLIPESLLAFIDLDKELSKIAEALKQSLGQLSSALLASTGALLDIVMTPIVTFYYLKDKQKMIAFLSSLFPAKRVTRIKTFAKEIDTVLGGFIKGQLLVASFVGVLTGIGCAVIGVPYALTIGLVAGLTNIIPYFGPWLGGIFPVLLALMNNLVTSLWVIIWIVIVQQVESSFISPQIMSQSVGLHPLTVIFSVLLFGNMFGIPGMIIGVPLTGILKVLLKHFIAFRASYRKSNTLA